MSRTSDTGERSGFQFTRPAGDGGDLRRQNKKLPSSSTHQLEPTHQQRNSNHNISNSSGNSWNVIKASEWEIPTSEPASSARSKKNPQGVVSYPPSEQQRATVSVSLPPSSMDNNKNMNMNLNMSPGAPLRSPAAVVSPEKTTCSTTLISSPPDTSVPDSYVSVIHQAYGIEADLYRDVLGVASTTRTPAALRIAYFKRGRQILQEAGVTSLEELSQKQISSASKLRFQAVSMAHEIVSSPVWLAQYQQRTKALLQEEEEERRQRKATESLSTAEVAASSISSAAPTSRSTSVLNRTGVLSAYATQTSSSFSKARSAYRRQDDQGHLFDHQTTSSSDALASAARPSIRWNEHVEELVYDNSDNTHSGSTRGRFKKKNKKQHQQQSIIDMNDADVEVDRNPFNSADDFLDTLEESLDGWLQNFGTSNNAFATTATAATVINSTTEEEKGEGHPGRLDLTNNSNMTEDAQSNVSSQGNRTLYSLGTIGSAGYSNGNSQDKEEAPSIASDQNVNHSTIGDNIKVGIPLAEVQLGKKKRSKPKHKVVPPSPPPIHRTTELQKSTLTTSQDENNSNINPSSANLKSPIADDIFDGLDESTYGGGTGGSAPFSHISACPRETTMSTTKSTMSDMSESIVTTPSLEQAAEEYLAQQRQQKRTKANKVKEASFLDATVTQADETVCTDTTAATELTSYTEAQEREKQKRRSAHEEAESGGFMDYVIKYLTELVADCTLDGNNWIMSSLGIDICEQGALDNVLTILEEEGTRPVPDPQDIECIYQEREQTSGGTLLSAKSFDHAVKTTSRQGAATKNTNVGNGQAMERVKSW